MKRLLICQLFTLLLTLPLSVSALENGAVAPDFALPNLDGKIVRLADFKGQIVLLKLATTWCPSCQEQTRELKLAEGDLQGKDVVLVEVFLQESAAAVNSYLAGRKLSLPAVALLDDDRVRHKYNVYTIPRLLILDRELRVVRDGGVLSAAELVKLVRQIGPV
ncbi:MAG: hypothetical protein A2005_05665 [Desulfuromonadales bacterium GWC2_61_20]|nr:MAG: hypothetical protein A2005_05665 [Desulfuromonadales bacterium GWC2_61_20]